MGDDARVLVLFLKHGGRGGRRWSADVPEGPSTLVWAGRAVHGRTPLPGSCGQLADPAGAVHRFNPVDGLVVHGGRENTRWCWFCIWRPSVEGRSLRSVFEQDDVVRDAGGNHYCVLGVVERVAVVCNDDDLHGRPLLSGLLPHPYLGQVLLFGAIPSAYRGDLGFGAESPAFNQGVTLG